ncbi:MmgE/PrpD family protein [Streptomyces sp. NPDC047002]|uniref:MmgE/PrpD family protein n=1 Tax=Streptomyces sp. NPDC047002 TaxID=3155475 RepID=UPI00345626D9
MSATDEAVDFVRTAEPSREALERAAAEVSVFRAAAAAGAGTATVHALRRVLAGPGPDPYDTADAAGTAGVAAAASAGPAGAAWVHGTAAALGTGPWPEWIAVCAAAAVLAPPPGAGGGPEAAELTAAVAVGREVARAIAAVLGAAHPAPGWSAAGAAGTVGATAAACRLLGLGAAELRHAFGLAATQAAGLAAADPTPAGAVRIGKAAADAVEAAVLARNGFTSSVLPFEGRRGMFALMAPAVDEGSRDLALGAGW